VLSIEQAMVSLNAANADGRIIKRVKVFASQRIKGPSPSIDSGAFHVSFNSSIFVKTNIISSN
jgi:hypothetical protein